MEDQEMVIKKKELPDYDLHKHIKEEIMKMSSYFQLWSKLKACKKIEGNDPGVFIDEYEEMVKYIYTDFSSTIKNFTNFEKEMSSHSVENKYLKQSL